MIEYRWASTMAISTQAYVNNLEEIVKRNVKGNFPVDWNEDFITRGLLKNIRNELGYITIDDFQFDNRINWIPYKLSGKPENKFGDIAILVKIHFQDGDNIEGVAFLEAKKRSKDSTKFDMLELSQLERIHSNAPNARVLLYDYFDVNQCAAFIPPQSLPRKGWEYKLSSCAVTLPMNLAIKTKKKDMTLYKFAIPFSYQLLYRYFQGLDLDFDENAIDVAKGYAIEKGLPDYLVAISITYGKLNRLGENVLEPIQINRELYTELGESRFPGLS